MLCIAWIGPWWKRVHDTVLIWRDLLCKSLNHSLPFCAFLTTPKYDSIIRSASKFVKSTPQQIVLCIILVEDDVLSADLYTYQSRSRKKWHLTICIVSSWLLVRVRPSHHLTHARIALTLILFGKYPLRESAIFGLRPQIYTNTITLHTLNCESRIVLRPCSPALFNINSNITLVEFEKSST